MFESYRPDHLITPVICTMENIDKYFQIHRFRRHVFWSHCCAVDMLQIGFAQSNQMDLLMYEVGLPVLYSKKFFLKPHTGKNIGDLMAYKKQWRMKWFI